MRIRDWKLPFLGAVVETPRPDGRSDLFPGSEWICVGAIARELETTQAGKAVALRHTSRSVEGPTERDLMALLGTDGQVPGEQDTQPRHCHFCLTLILRRHQI